MNQINESNLGEIFGKFVSTMQEVKTTLDNINRGGVLYPQYLDNCIDAVQSAPEGGLDPMAYKRERVYLGLDDNGKPLLSWIDGKTEDERDIKKFVAILQSGRAWQIPEFRELVMAGAFMQPLQSVPMKPKKDFCKYAEAWYNRYKNGVIKAGSSYQVHYCLKAAEKFFQGRFLEDITTNDIQDFMNVNKRYGHKTLQDFKGVLHDLFQHAEDSGDVEPGKINWKHVKNPGNREQRRKAQTDRHYSDIVAHIHDLDGFPMEQLIIGLFAYLGLRPEEVRGLKWEDIDLDAKRLHIERAVVYPGRVRGPVIQDPKTKGSKTWLPISDELYEILAKHKQESGWLVHEPSGEPLWSDHHWQKVWKSIGSHINLYGMKSCEFRKTVATVMVSRGISVKSVQRTLRHASAKTTLDIYAETEPETFLNDCNRLGIG